MRERQVHFARYGAPFDLVLMHEHNWLPEQVAAIPNRTVLELLALRRLEAERANRASRRGGW